MGSFASQRAAVDAPQPEGSGAAAGTGATPPALEPRTTRVDDWP